MLNKSLFSSNSDVWSTPDDLFNILDREFHFTLDPASDDFNFKCKNHYTFKENGLLQDWSNNNVFLNPPYGKDIYKWIEKSYNEFLYKPNVNVVLLLPVRTDTRWFHDFIYNKFEIRFLKGRLKFGGSKNSAPFPSMVVIMRGDKNNECN